MPQTGKKGLGIAVAHPIARRKIMIVMVMMVVIVTR